MLRPFIPCPASLTALAGLRAHPSLLLAVTALVQEVFSHAAGEEAAAAVLAFLRRQHLTSLWCARLAAGGLVMVALVPGHARPLLLACRKGFWAAAKMYGLSRQAAHLSHPLSNFV